MKLLEIFTPLMEYRGEALTDEEMEVSYELIKHRELNTVEDLEEFVELASPRYPRSAGSLKFLAIRMHGIIHGYLPQGLSPNSIEKMFTNSENKPIKEYIIKQGDFSKADLFDLTRIANHSLKRYNAMRGEGDGPAIGAERAKQRVERFYDSGEGNLKEVLPRSEFLEKKWDIIELVMIGWKVIRAFKKIAPKFTPREVKMTPRLSARERRNEAIQAMIANYIRQNKPGWATEGILKKIQREALKLDQVTNQEISKLFDLARRNKI